ncbi:hypothetical protein GCM10022419_083540 [Nonomuraea rosea]|uniref:Phytase-like domain-containing protein n=1 Tax=Nonomuraea rosea TaxID=638574 RepID=A0ABP6YQS2_9ACTN
MLHPVLAPVLAGLVLAAPQAAAVPAAPTQAPAVVKDVRIPPVPLGDLLDRRTLVVANDNDFGLGEFGADGRLVDSGVPSHIVTVRLARPVR